MPNFNVLQPEVDIDHYNNIKKNIKKVKIQPTSKNENVTKNVKKQKDKPIIESDVVIQRKKERDEASKSVHLARFQILIELVFYYICIGIKELFLYLTLMVSKLQELAFCTNPKRTATKQTGSKSSRASKPSQAPVTNKPKSKKGKGKKIPEADDEWKKRDNVYIANLNNKNLEEGILQSKLENQKKQATQKKLASVQLAEKENEDPKETVEPKKNKKKKPTTISLDEFQRGNTAEPVNKKKTIAPTVTVNTDVPKKKNKKVKDKFFDDVKEATKSTLLKEKQQEKYKNDMKIEEGKVKEQNYTANVEKRDFEIQALRLELDSLKTELTNVKQRNRKLCEVIGCSEMKPKGELVVQLAKASKTRDEYSEEVSKLSIELEQEKTKVSNLTQDIKKLQGRKRNADN